MVADPIRVGVSSCLLGNRVRYDGGDRRDDELVEALGGYFKLVPVCPEVESGLPTPREPMRLEGEAEHPRLVTRHTRIDLTDKVLAFSRKRVEALAGEELSGFVFKRNSPNSGLHRVKVYRDGRATKNGRGLFAAEVVRRFPLLPVEEAETLADPLLRDHFIERVNAYARLQRFLKGNPGPGRLVEFHTAHKLVLMAHSPALYRELGALVGKGGELPRAELLRRYAELYLKAFSLLATVKKQTNVLMHVMGYFKKRLGRAEKEELAELIRRYHDGEGPLEAPLAALGRCCLRFDDGYLRGQLYLAPFPSGRQPAPGPRLIPAEPSQVGAPCRKEKG